MESEIIYSEATLSKIRQNRGLVTIHTHPSSSPPSHADLLSNYVHGYSLGIVCGHNGKVYVYTANEAFIEEHYNGIVGKAFRKCKDEETAIACVVEELQRHFKVIVKEVK